MNTQTTTDRPNVIWIFGDQHRAQALGHMGDPNVHTPSIDRMAGDGVTFRNAVSGNPWCTPFRACLLTSRYPHETCVRTPQQLDPSIPTVAQPFNEAGYDTAYFGKWHLDGHPESESRSAFHVVPPERRGGFKTWIGYENNNSQYDCWVHGHDENGNDVPLRKLPTYETDALTDLLLDYLAKRRQGAEGDGGDGDAGQPFFAVLSVQPPHGPYVAPREFMARHTPGEIQLRPNVPEQYDIAETARRQLAGYYAQIENLDWNIGRVRDALDRLGLADDTHVIFFSDHGDMHGSHACFGKSVPYEESIRIPFTIAGRIPHYEHRGGRVDAPINHVDIAPTTLGLCGLDTPDWMRGFDYSAYRRKDRHCPPPGQPDSAFLQHNVPKYHSMMLDRTWRGIVTADGWKYVAVPHQPFMLHNLNDDPFEQVNLAMKHKYRDIRKRLQDRLAGWIHDTGDEFALPEL
ncbi:MAG: sulfatase [Phycisphaerae bacterium]